MQTQLPKGLPRSVERLNDEDAGRFTGPSRKHLEKIVLQPKFVFQRRECRDAGQQVRRQENERRGLLSDLIGKRDEHACFTRSWLADHKEASAVDCVLQRR